MKQKVGVTSGSGGTTSHLKRQAIKFGIDFSHFPKNGVNVRNMKSAIRRKWVDILICHPEHTIIKSHLLRRCLIESGRTHKCEGGCCENEGKWLGKLLRLQVHHKNGKRNDNRPCNLLFLCPNCHSQTANYAFAKSPQEFVLPVLTLKTLLESKSVQDVAKLCCVSATTVIGWIRQYNVAVGVNKRKDVSATVARVDKSSRFCACGSPIITSSAWCETCRLLTISVKNRKVTRPSKIELA